MVASTVLLPPPFLLPVFLGGGCYIWPVWQKVRLGFWKRCGGSSRSSVCPSEEIRTRGGVVRHAWLLARSSRCLHYQSKKGCGKRKKMPIAFTLSKLKMKWLIMTLSFMYASATNGRCDKKICSPFFWRDSHLRNLPLEFPMVFMLRVGGSQTSSVVVTRLLCMVHALWCP